jgi:hypothetical protein
MTAKGERCTASHHEKKYPATNGAAHRSKVSRSRVMPRQEPSSRQASPFRSRAGTRACVRAWKAWARPDSLSQGSLHGDALRMVPQFRSASTNLRLRLCARLDRTVRGLRARTACRGVIASGLGEPAAQYRGG